MTFSSQAPREGRWAGRVMRLRTMFGKPISSRLNQHRSEDPTRPPHSIDQWTHDHVFLGSRHQRHERRTWLVVGLTALMMVGEIAGGWLSGSMALLADGWHMATHATALGIAALAYLFARRHTGNS